MRALTRSVAVALCAVALAGCGIRPTSVPVDAGSAPTRARCGSEDPPAAPRKDGSAQVDVFLVCGPKVSPVRRGVRPPAGSAATVRAYLERELLAQLLREPGPRESTDGYDTDVARIALSAPRAGDPPRAVRFDRDPEELSKQGLAQLVCTFAALDDGTRAVLGTRAQLREYDCTRAVQDDPLRVLEGSREYRVSH
ncbi:hypothetical protein SRB5_60930 [Streptomyces sp. RB5]|uniref:Lipoprotein n=1 Tax=Streptomyces smaragdinus TaxID=2585196 RepID=A0A7K0CR65_9ACTN|nr:hypothetical protein [Streptomyces smaragdinus]MQY15901.1 hypothetical protein [Streptomyces smaragdinus]